MGADGDFGPATRWAVDAYQFRKGLDRDGIVGTLTRMTMERDLPDGLDNDKGDVDKEPEKIVLITGGDAYIRLIPNKDSGPIIGVARDGDRFIYGNEIAENNWVLVVVYEEKGWVSDKYARVIDKDEAGYNAEVLGYFNTYRGDGWSDQEP